MSPITTHVLDTALGKPAVGLTVRLERQEPPEIWRELARRSTDANGRIGDLLAIPLDRATYRLIFETGAYFARLGQPQFYPVIEVQFRIEALSEHYHVPLLLSPFGYSTYRGS